MAQQLIFTCSSCGFTVEAWSDGNPYIEGPDGTRHHFYHPGEEQGIRHIVATLLGHEPTRAEIDGMLREHSGNEGDFQCLECRSESKRNEREAKEPCTKCGAATVVDTWHLAGHTCPACREGTFDQGRQGAIS